MRHINFFSGGPHWGVLGGGPEVYVENVYVLFLSLSCASRFCTGGRGARSNRSKNLLEGPMKANASSGAESEALDGGREVGHPQQPGPENQEGQHM